jgi:hypothetical protein
LTFLGIQGESAPTPSKGAGASSAASSAKSAGGSGNSTQKGEKDNVGAAIFRFVDTEADIDQKFLFNLRYYKSAGGGEYGTPADGMYEFAVEANNATKKGHVESKA